jgi:hypothetical protein
MNVHYLSGITIDAAGAATDAGADLTVYDDTFDHFQYDVGHLAEYAPTWQSKTYGYPEAPATPVVTQTTTTTNYPSTDYSSQSYGQQSSYSDPYS